VGIDTIIIIYHIFPLFSGNFQLNVAYLNQEVKFVVSTLVP